MTNSQKHVVKELKALISDVDNLSVRYEFQDFSNSHLIEILPEILFENEYYNELEWNIKERFYLEFPNESLVFFTKTHPITINDKNVLYRHAVECNSSFTYSMRLISPMHHKMKQISEFMYHPYSEKVDFNQLLNKTIHFDFDKVTNPTNIMSTTILHNVDKLGELNSLVLTYNSNSRQTQTVPNIDSKYNCLV